MLNSSFQATLALQQWLQQHKVIQALLEFRMPTEPMAPMEALELLGTMGLRVPRERLGLQDARAQPLWFKALWATQDILALQDPQGLQGLPEQALQEPQGQQEQAPQEPPGEQGQQAPLESPVQTAPRPQ